MPASNFSPKMTGMARYGRVKEVRTNYDSFQVRRMRTLCWAMYRFRLLQALKLNTRKVLQRQLPPKRASTSGHFTFRRDVQPRLVFKDGFRAQAMGLLFMAIRSPNNFSPWLNLWDLRCPNLAAI